MLGSFAQYGEIDAPKDVHVEDPLPVVETAPRVTSQPNAGIVYKHGNLDQDRVRHERPRPLPLRSKKNGQITGQSGRGFSPVF